MNEIVVVLKIIPQVIPVPTTLLLVVLAAYRNKFGLLITAIFVFFGLSSLSKFFFGSFDFSYYALGVVFSLLLLPIVIYTYNHSFLKRLFYNMDWDVEENLDSTYLGRVFMYLVGKIKSKK